LAGTIVLVLLVVLLLPWESVNKTLGAEQTPRSLITKRLKDGNKSKFYRPITKKVAEKDRTFSDPLVAKFSE
jgi:hypothetical protein